jgi:hypothetical protein
MQRIAGSNDTDLAGLRGLPKNGQRMRGERASIGQEYAGVIEQHDTVAQQAPPLLWMRRDDVSCFPVGSVGRRAPRPMQAHDCHLDRACKG